MSSIRTNKIDAMHRLYGVDPGDGICADCQHLVKTVWDRTYYKCALYGVSHSEATDWRKHWQACILIDHDPEPDNWVPVVERLKHEPRGTERTELDGQIGIEEILNDGKQND